MKYFCLSSLNLSLLILIVSLNISFTQQSFGKIEEPLYRILLEQVGDHGLWEQRENAVPVHIDTRFLINNPEGVEEIKIIDTEKDKIAAYKEIIGEYEAVPADILKDRMCYGTGGLKPPPHEKQIQEKANIPEYCKEIGNFVTLIFSLPELVEMKTENDTVTKIKIQAVEISSYTFGSYELIFSKEMEKEWKFINRKQLMMIMN